MAECLEHSKVVCDFLAARELRPAASAPVPLDYGGLILVAMAALILLMAWMRRQERRRSGR